MRHALPLAAALLLAGCAAPQPLGFSGDEAAREPYYTEYREVVAPHTERTKLFSVDEGATALNVTLALSQRDNGLPLPEAAGARVVLTLADAKGREAGTATADAVAPRAQLLVTTPEAGAWTLRLEGSGASGMFEDASYGAEYLLTIEVLYA